MLQLDRIRLIALDLDGTLLNPGAIISKDTIREMERLHRSGVYIGIATGRPMDTTLDLLKTNGIEAKQGLIQVLMCEERDIYLLEGDQYNPHSSNPSAFDEEISCLNFSKGLMKTVEDSSNKFGFYINNRYLQHRRGFVEVICTSSEDSRRLYKVLEALTMDTPVHPIRNGHGVSLRSKKAGKGITLAKAASIFKVHPASILAMGDSHNDWDMLGGDFQAATTQNADEEIKELIVSRGGIIADAHCSDGVAEILKKIP